MIGIVVGLEAEARLARRLPGAIRVAAGGGTAEGARRAAERLLAQGARGLISFGLAAGLSPDLLPGDVLVPRRVVIDGTFFHTDRRLCQTLGGVTEHDLLHSERIIATAEEKRRLFATTGCSALDMESGVVARAALAEARPFAVLRAVCDPADRSLPPASLVALSADGRIDVVRLLGSITRRPGQIGDLIILGRDAFAARDSLRRRIRLVGAGR
jgi:hopanoid-associated phosphorylase